MNNIIVLVLVSMFFSTNVCCQVLKEKGKQYFYDKIHFDLVDGKIIIPAIIGKKKYRFLLDTGSPNIISSRIFDDIQLKTERKISVGDSGGHKKDLNFIFIPGITLGNTTHKHKASFVFDINEHEILKCYNVDGIIGSNTFNNAIIQINYKSNFFIVTNDIDRLNNLSNQVNMLVKGQQRIPFIDLRFGQSRDDVDRVLIDTGMNDYYIISSQTYGVLKNKIFRTLSKAEGNTLTSLFGAEKKSVQHLLFLPKFYVGQAEIINLVTHTTENGFSAIGNKLFQLAIVTIDFINEKFYFEIAGSKDVSEPMLGFSPVIQHGKLSVGYIWDEQLRGVLSYGDEIVKIDAYDISNLNLCQIIDIKTIINKNMNPVMEFKKKNGDTYIVKMIKKDLALVQ